MNKPSTSKSLGAVSKVHTGWADSYYTLVYKPVEIGYSYFQYQDHHGSMETPLALLWCPRELGIRQMRSCLWLKRRHFKENTEESNHLRTSHLQFAYRCNIECQIWTGSLLTGNTLLYKLIISSVPGAFQAQSYSASTPETWIKSWTLKYQDEGQFSVRVNVQAVIS